MKYQDCVEAAQAPDVAADGETSALAAPQAVVDGLMNR
jgi:hypothetical protein